MFDEILFSIRLSRLQAQQRRVALENDQKIKQARKEGKPDSDAIQRLEYEAQIDDQDYRGTIAQMQTRHLIRLAGKYLLPYPKAEDWAKSESPFFYTHLTPEASTRLRASIRLEQKERWERRVRWLPIITALTGLLGVLIGVIAAIKY